VLRAGGEGGAMSGVTISRARTDDLDVVEALLEREQLLVDGLRQHVNPLWVARAGNRVVGCAGLEVYGDVALLRSVAVAAEQRHSGVGSALTSAALEEAARSGIAVVYLFTKTAERFFPRFGFEIVDRADLPASVQSSVEFAHACCADAVVMRTLLPAR
jgi:amino-acid N-acetyltransferase